MPDLFDDMAVVAAARVLALSDPASGLKALVALDDLTLGPACGGIRTMRYSGVGEALADAQRLAAAMTLKCAIAGLPAGGGKTVVLDHPGLDRAAAFGRLGEFIESLGGLYRAAGDLGTRQEDLLRAAERTRYVNTTGARLGEATGEGVVNCIRALAAHRGREITGLSVAVQGCGLIGSGVARLLAAAGATLVVADVDAGAAERLAREVGGEAVGAGAILQAPVDVVSPCATGGVITTAAAGAMRAWGVCGGANNQLGDSGALPTLVARGISYVPDFLASAGAVIDGIAREVGDGNGDALIARLHDTAAEVLAESALTGEDTDAVARRMARRNIAQGHNRALSVDG
ncbi:Glu/Leu/Phe/Val dehydrogenase dimerization domain-containing protein [uncultured Sphingomonas sp.]|uniref:Glu/Leu/Phe/Val dehydrogenase dimerization domain-containing protein n=1 Tax=uncultured Sphingomonas sp. TaxID=158754 RepID=UPI0035CAA126